MSFTQISIIVTLATLLVSWWLSSYDARIIGDGRGWDWVRRIARCVITAALVEGMAWCGWRFSHEGGTIYEVIPIPIIILVAVFWSGSVGELLSRGFGKLFDSDGGQAADPLKGEEGLRQLSVLVREGRHEEAARLSQKLQKSGDTNIIVLEAMMQHLGVDAKLPDKAKSLADARKLKRAGRFTEAERLLTGLLKQYPDYTEAAVFQIVVLVQDLGQVDRAREAFEELKRQPGTSPGMIEFARTLLPVAEPTVPQPQLASERVFLPGKESVDDLIAQRRFSTAIALLNQKLKAQPGDFAMWSKLAEVNGLHCGSFQAVENIIRVLGAEPGITPEQVESLRLKLQEWRTHWKVARTTAGTPAAAPSLESDPASQQRELNI